MSEYLPFGDHFRLRKAALLQSSKVCIIMDFTWSGPVHSGAACQKRREHHGQHGVSLLAAREALLARAVAVLRGALLLPGYVAVLTVLRDAP